MQVKYQKRMLFTLVILLFYHQSCVYGGNATTNSIVAMVDGISISSKDIDSREDILTEIKSKRENISDKEIENLVITEEKELLTKRIEYAIKTHKIKELGLTVSEEELEKEAGKVIDGVPSDEKIRIDRKNAALVGCLKEVLKNPSSSDQIYNAKLTGIMSRDEWDHDKKVYDSPESVADLEKLIPLDWGKVKQQMKQHAMKQFLLDKKLEATITKDVLVTEDELTRYIENEKHVKNLGSNKEKIRGLYKNELLESKKQAALKGFWETAYKKANIQIIDNRFSDVLRKFKK